MSNIYVINGPNLNLLGLREPHIYGKETLNDIENYTQKKCQNLAVSLKWLQSNVEGELVNYLQQAKHANAIGVIFNPGGYAHTSVALHDAIKSIQLPVVEVHLSQVHQREEFRQVLLTAKACMGIMSGFGKDVYWLAVNSLLKT
jgi:3-dehydroquinate dehydratase-2